MTVDSLIVELQKVANEGRGHFTVVDAKSREIGWVQRGSAHDDHEGIVRVCLEVDL